MRIGFYTSTFKDLSMEEVVDFAVIAGFDAIEFDIAGHIKTPDQVAGAVKVARDHGLYVSAITLVGNQLDPDPAKRRDLRARTPVFATAATEAEVPILVIFPGRDDTADEDANYKGFAEFANELVTSTSGVDFAIENWPGPQNAFIAITPAGWHRLLALVPDKRFGIEFDPSHLIRLGINPYAAYEGVKDRVKILHGKDTSIDEAQLQASGYHSKGRWRYRLPGSGLLDWVKFLRQAKDSGFDGTISIEHEDSDFGWPGKSLDARKQGEKQALKFLRTTLSAA
jgi:sugar phosphate isomerase/epimerase